MHLNPRLAPLVFTLLLYFLPAAAAPRARVVAVKPIVPAGTLQILNAESDAGENSVLYRFRVRRSDQEFEIVRDFGPSPVLEWTSLNEGTYEIEATLRDAESGAESVATTWIEFQPLSVLDEPVVTQTAHPLVMIYSAPPCDPALTIRVSVFDTAGQEQHTTPPHRCRADGRISFYLAGLRPETQYVARQVSSEGEPGPVVEFTTREIPGNLSPRIPAQRVLEGTPSLGGVLIQSPLPPAIPVATDLNANIIWYYPSSLLITRPEPGGLFFGLNRNATDPATSFVRLFDLAGVTVLETTAAAVNLQLKELGKRPISTFHHEARLLPDGNIAVLATVEQMMTDVQGEGEINVIGDMIVVLNRKLEVVWTWDSFDHLDVRRAAVMGETCLASGACDPWFLAPDGNDWLHGNAVTVTPDGNFLYSSRHQDWLIKINYNGGNGDGSVLWRLGHAGDFAIDSDDPFPWFSHQHDGALWADGLLTVFDNGNTRRTAAEGQGNSRAQVYRIDEEARTATLVVNKDLGEFAAAVGSSQQLPNGHYHFGSGWMPGYSAVSFELDAEGNVVFALRTAAWTYRTYRMPDLYSIFGE